MRIKESSRMIVLFIIFLSTIGVGALLNTYRLTDLHKEVGNRLLSATEAIDKLVAGSERYIDHGDTGLRCDR